MALCWPLQMPPTPKAVLISLADNANDHGECWPSIPKICERTCFSERAVQNAITWLEARGAVAADRSNGRHTRYCVTPNKYQQPPHDVHPRTTCTPAAGAPTPAADAGDPRTTCTQPPQEVPSNRKEPSRTINKSNRQKAPACAVSRPDGVSPQTWADWLALRKAKKAPVTETVLQEAIRESAKAGLTLSRFLEIWCSRGSQGLQADWLKPNERAGPGQVPSKPSAAADFRGKTYDATPIDELPEYLRDAMA